MLNEAPNNNDVTCIGNIVLNEAPNSNDATHIANNVCLATSCTKANLSQMRDNDTITLKVHTDGNKLCPGKEWRLYAQ